MLTKELDFNGLQIVLSNPKIDFHEGAEIADLSRVSFEDLVYFHYNLDIKTDTRVLFNRVSISNPSILLLKNALLDITTRNMSKAYVLEHKEEDAYKFDYNILYEQIVSEKNNPLSDYTLKIERYDAVKINGDIKNPKWSKYSLTFTAEDIESKINPNTKISYGTGVTLTDLTPQDMKNLINLLDAFTQEAFQVGRLS